MFSPAGRGGETVLYSSVGAKLTAFSVDVDRATLAAGATVTLPADVQSAMPDPRARHLYVVSSDGGPGRGPGRTHTASAFRIDPGSGALTGRGEPQRLPSRPIHCCVDAAGDFLLTAFNAPSAVTVHEIRRDGTLGASVEQPASLDCGTYAHQIRVIPGHDTVLLPARGNDAGHGAPEDPGAIKVLRLRDGRLANEASIGPGGGLGFRPRHLDFHPIRPWVFVVVESQNELHVYELLPDGSLAAEPSFVASTLADPSRAVGGQMAGAIHVHPTGRWVYVTNRNSEVVDACGAKISVGGQNDVAVFAIDETTGKPTLVDHADPQSVHVRTLSVDATGRLLVAASIEPATVRVGSGLATLPARLSVFRIGDDGALALVRAYDVPTPCGLQFWSGMVELPRR
jgi:6-phosphogluconolactonase (cycloisomerase 2 family)